MGKTSESSVSKSNRKFEKKLLFYSKVKDSIASLNAQKSIAKVRTQHYYYCSWDRLFEPWIERTSVDAVVFCQKKSKQQRRQSKLKAYNLSSLLDSLPELKPKASRKPGHEDDFKLNCKSRHKLILKERERLSAVLGNHNFQADPLSAIHQYLQNTLPVVEEQPKKKVNKNKNGSQKKKDKKSKASTGLLQSMEM
ncbi:hypothetical protein RJT34_25399 [Clitoria ternatea]|uniref:Uncharacterized protein n=1 Tax=Clitoria ternatea TaxID=43366 RepID=A0AAN9FSF0_CLITE